MATTSKSPSITLATGLGAGGKGWSWLSFTRNLISESSKLPPTPGGFGQWEMAAVAAAMYGPRAAGKAEALSGKAAAATPEAKEAMLRYLRSIWVGEPDPKVEVGNLDVLHAAARGLWAEWSKSKEGVAALAKRAGKSGMADDDKFLSLASIGKAAAAKPPALAAAQATKDRNELARLEERAALLRARTAARLAQLAGDE